MRGVSRGVVVGIEREKRYVEENKEGEVEKDEMHPINSEYPLYVRR